MPRQPRLDAPGALHHIMDRGIEGTDIFKTDKDRNDLLERMAAQCEAQALNIYAWAKYGYPGASVARFLGVTTSLVNRYAASSLGDSP